MNTVQAKKFLLMKTTIFQINEFFTPRKLPANYTVYHIVLVDSTDLCNDYRNGTFSDL